jgi:fructokinase
VGRVERLVARSHIVKASDQDVQWLYPGESPDEVLRRWAQLGPSLVVVTRGASGADALSDGAMLHVDAPAASVVDTIGAGDSFMAALLAFVIREGMARPQAAIEFAARCAAITVSRAGADPPRLTDLE